MNERTQSFSAQQLYAPLRNWGVALAITTVGVIASDLWLDQPIAFFVHRIVADKTIFVWLLRLPVVFLLLSLIVLAWCGLWALINRPFSRFQSVGLACSISFIATNFVNSQLKYAFGRTWPDTWIENNPSLIQNGVFGFNPFHGGPGFASFPSGHVAAVCAVMGSSLVVVCKLAPDLYCLRSRGCNWGDWRELSFFERCYWRKLCRHNRRLLNEENGAFKNSSVRVEAWFLKAVY